MFKRMLKNWKTTLSGAGTIALVAIRASQGQFDYETDGALLVLGVGQLFGKDSNVTGGTKPQDNLQPRKAGSFDDESPRSKF